MRSALLLPNRATFSNMMDGRSHFLPRNQNVRYPPPRPSRVHHFFLSPFRSLNENILRRNIHLFFKQKALCIVWHAIKYFWKLIAYESHLTLLFTLAVQIMRFRLEKKRNEEKPESLPPFQQREHKWVLPVSFTTLLLSSFTSTIM